ncbi:MAG TPA: LodA/GoxA family CTQ-dependent oxidase, partial [Thermoanaerobaculia bacterium]
APNDVANYLALDLTNRLRRGEARFRFMVQLQTNDREMPVDKATVRWSEDKSEPVHVATLILPRQDVDANGQAGYGENLSFNPWHSIAAHKPLGSISDARKVVYHASAAVRRDANGIPSREPGTPRPPLPPPSETDTRVVKAAIHPSIGVARVGNSQNEYFLAPEVVVPIPHEPGFYRDSTGALKRQAVRFRIYGLNAAGKAVTELTADDATIEWEVHLANKKAAWYEFQLALDIPEAASTDPSLLRNPGVANRDDLVIDPGARSIKGKRARPKKFDGGKFMGTEVYLGELRTDEKGRLIVLGGRGVSASYNGSKAVTFANNDGWHDDVSDGPVTATVVYRGEKLRVDPAWVVVAPPDYAPMQKSVRTMWDLMRDLAIANNMLPRPVRPSFESDIRPLFERMTNLQWVNAGFAAAFGWDGPNNLSTPEWLERLSSNAASTREMRRTLANHFRNFDRDSFSPTPWPWMYGDAMAIPPAPTPRQNVALTATQLTFLQQWAVGDFIADYDPARKPIVSLDEVSIVERPAFLDKASLDYCLADAFHPGCEMTWPVRSALMYMAPFRFLHAEKGWTEPSFGGQMIQSTLTLPNGPLAAQVPGGVTRWMAIPWQCDTASCRSGYLKSYDPYVPSFWPARVPNQVLSDANYDIVMDKSRPQGERLAAFATRSLWIRGLGTKSYTDQINNMIGHFGDLGVVEFREGPDDLPLPQEMQVENLPRKAPVMLLRSSVDMKTLAVAPNIQVDETDVDLTGIEKVQRFPHGLRRD